MDSFINKALNWLTIKIDHAKDLDESSIFLTECDQAVKDSLKILEYTENFRRIVGKLPYTLHERWRNIAQEKREHKQRPVFQDLVKYVCKEAQKANDPLFGTDTMKDSPKPQHGTSRSGGSFALKLISAKETSASYRPIVNNGSRPNAFTSPCFWRKDKLLEGQRMLLWMFQVRTPSQRLSAQD